MNSLRVHRRGTRGDWLPSRSRGGRHAGDQDDRHLPFAASISPAALVLAGVIAAAAQPWSARALSAQTDPDLFFSDSVDRTEQAKAICRRCPARGECLAHALRTREDYGVWGGLDRDERRQLLRKHNTARPQETDRA